MVGGLTENEIEVLALVLTHPEIFDKWEYDLACTLHNEDHHSEATDFLHSVIADFKIKLQKRSVGMGL